MQFDSPILMSQKLSGSVSRLKFNSGTSGIRSHVKSGVTPGVDMILDGAISSDIVMSDEVSGLIDVLEGETTIEFCVLTLGYFPGAGFSIVCVAPDLQVSSQSEGVRREIDWSESVTITNFWHSQTASFLVDSILEADFFEASGGISFCAFLSSGKNLFFRVVACAEVELIVSVPVSFRLLVAVYEHLLWPGGKRVTGLVFRPEVLLGLLRVLGNVILKFFDHFNCIVTDFAWVQNTFGKHLEVESLEPLSNYLLISTSSLKIVLLFDIFLDEESVTMVIKLRVFNLV